MSDWNFLNANRVSKPTPRIPSQYISHPSDGFNGMFRFIVYGIMLRAIASDGLGWKHVSVSIEGERKCPSWSVMCKVKDMFWNDDEWVVQFHPEKSEYVNFHPGCLHLWSSTEAVMPTPPSILVGPK